MKNKLLAGLSEQPGSITVNLTAADLEEFARMVARETAGSITTEEKKPSGTWMTPEQVCERLGKTRATIWRWNRSGYLRGQRFGGRLRYAESEVARVEAAEKGGRS